MALGVYQRTKQMTILVLMEVIFLWRREETVNDRHDQQVTVQCVRGDECDREKRSRGRSSRTAGARVGILRRVITIGASEKATVEQRLEGVRALDKQITAERL